MDEQHGLMPSNATNGSMLAGAIAVMIISAFHMKGIDFPAGVEAALATILTCLGGYLPRTGRRKKL